MFEKAIEILPVGLRHSSRELAKEICIHLYHYKGWICSGRYLYSTSLKLNLGCGYNIKEKWVNIDLFNDIADLSLDLREPLPFKKSSCEIIYSEHFLEHLQYPDELEKFLKEAYRVLKPGGTFNVGVPDTEWPLQAYCNKDEKDYFKFVKQKWHPTWCTTRMEHINYHFHQGGEHFFAYDFETLKYVLKKAGFDTIERREFNPILDSEERRRGTLYVEAVKPTVTCNN